MKLFKTDGIRGKFNEDITLDLAYNLGNSLAILGDKVIIGYDTRYSGSILANEVKQGCFSCGIESVIIGVCSTPKLQFYSKRDGVVGVMITASHNPYYDNGFKVFICGEKINENLEELLENSISNSFTYEEKLRNMIIESSKKIALDGGYGGASLILKRVFKEKRFHLINVNYDGYNINLNCGALDPNDLTRYVLDNKLDFGFSFDGDADRVIACDSLGNVLDGDYLCYILACHYKCDRVVLTKMCNYGVIEAFKKKNVDVYLCDSGDKNVVAKMKEVNALVGSEASGHIIDMNCNCFGDGVVNAINIMNIISQNNVADYNEIVKYPAILRNYNYIASLDEIKYLYELINKEFPHVIPYIRMSGTEKCLRVYLQGTCENMLNKAFSLIEEYYEGSN